MAVSPEQRHASHEDDAEGGGLVELKAAAEEDENSIERWDSEGFVCHVRHYADWLVAVRSGSEQPYLD